MWKLVDVTNVVIVVSNVTVIANTVGVLRYLKQGDKIVKLVVYVMEDGTHEYEYVDCRMTLKQFTGSKRHPVGWKRCRIKLRGKWHNIYVEDVIKLKEN
jgi:hypothetical protein